MAKPEEDFQRALAALNATEPRDLPPMHPDQLLNEAGRGGQMPAAQISQKKYDAKYKKFSLDNVSDVEELEEITNHILNDGWIPGREEWLHMPKTGTSYVILKYLIPKEKPVAKKKAKEPVRHSAKPKSAKPKSAKPKRAPRKS